MAAFITALNCPGASGDAANQFSLKSKASLISRNVTGAMPGVLDTPGHELNPSMSSGRKPAPAKASKIASKVRFRGLRSERRPARASPIPDIAAPLSRISTSRR